jgi:hypothetical protein
LVTEEKTFHGKAETNFGVGGMSYEVFRAAHEQKRGKGEVVQTSRGREVSTKRCPSFAVCSRVFCITFESFRF